MYFGDAECQNVRRPVFAHRAIATASPSVIDIALTNAGESYTFADTSPVSHCVLTREENGSAQPGLNSSGDLCKR